jgi:hypothetical protein
VIVHRARRVQRFPHKRSRGEQFTDYRGLLVSIEDTIYGFQFDHGRRVDKFPEALSPGGTIEQAIAKGEKNAGPNRSSDDLRLLFLRNMYIRSNTPEKKLYAGEI